MRVGYTLSNNIHLVVVFDYDLDDYIPLVCITPYYLRCILILLRLSWHAVTAFGRYIWCVNCGDVQYHVVVHHWRHNRA